MPAATSAARPPRLRKAVARTATRLLPLVALLDAIQPAVEQESVFRTRRRKIKQHFRRLYAELHADQPRHHALAHVLQALTALVHDETHDIGRDELKQAAREVVLATLKNAPALLNLAHQARLLA